MLEKSEVRRQEGVGLPAEAWAKAGWFRRLPITCL